MVAKRKTRGAGKTAESKGAYRTAPGKEASKIIDAYLRRRSPELKLVAEEVRRLVKKTMPGAREAVNPWGIPTFDFHGPLCFMMVGKNHVTFGFPRGTSLNDPAGLLEGTGKNLRHVKVKEAEQLREAGLRGLLLESARLNRDTPLTPSMRVKKAE